VVKPSSLQILKIIQDESIEERLRKEFKEKLNVQQQRIRDKINSKINQLLLMHQNKQQELDRKEQQMKKKYSEAAMMPDITEAHMLKGLSVVKGSSNDEIGMGV
jgi:sensor domain CHASE-containing protein